MYKFFEILQQYGLADQHLPFKFSNIPEALGNEVVQKATGSYRFGDAINGMIELGVIEGNEEHGTYVVLPASKFAHLVNRYYVYKGLIPYMPLPPKEEL